MGSGRVRAGLDDRSDVLAAQRRGQPARNEPVHDLHMLDVAGVGHVNHQHDVVFHASTAFLDDWAHLLGAATCSPTTLSEATWPAASPTLPSETASSSDRRPFSLTLTLSSAIAELFLHRFTRTEHAIIGSASAAALSPSCLSALDSAGGSTYRVSDVHATHGSGGDGTVEVALTFSPAPLLAGFLSAYWKHVVQEVAEESSPHAPHNTSSSASPRGLESFDLFNAGVNWQYGGVVKPVMPLGSWAYGAASAQVDCVGCFMGVSETLDVELSFCA